MVDSVLEQAIHEILDHETVDYSPSDTTQRVQITFESAESWRTDPGAFYRLLERMIGHLCEPIVTERESLLAAFCVHGRVKDYHPWQLAGLREVQ